MGRTGYLRTQSSKARQKVLSVLREQEGGQGRGWWATRSPGARGESRGDGSVCANPRGKGEICTDGVVQEGHAREENKLKPRHRVGDLVGLVKAADRPRGHGHVGSGWVGWGWGASVQTGWTL